MCHVSPVNCHLSPVTFHLSPVTCYMSPNIIITKGNGISWYYLKILNVFKRRKKKIILELFLTLLHYKIGWYNKFHVQKPDFFFLCIERKNSRCEIKHDYNKRKWISWYYLRRLIVFGRKQFITKLDGVALINNRPSID